MKINQKFLDKHNPCTEGVIWVKDQGLIGMEAAHLVEKQEEKK